ncbi:MAG: hypothetical protein ABI833_12075 [Acidobacteriota bacterium]
MGERSRARQQCIQILVRVVSRQGAIWLVEMIGAKIKRATK